MEEEPADIGGYDFVFIDELSPVQTCSICLHAMRNPVQTVCGHRFCETCLLETFRWCFYHARLTNASNLDIQFAWFIRDGNSNWNVQLYHREPKHNCMLFSTYLSYWILCYWIFQYCHGLIYMEIVSLNSWFTFLQARQWYILSTR